MLLCRSLLGCNEVKTELAYQNKPAFQCHSKIAEEPGLLRGICVLGTTMCLRHLSDVIKIYIIYFLR